MLPYSPVNPSFISTSLPMDKSSGFHISKTASINKPLSVESQPKPQYSFRQRLGRLKLSISPSNDKLGAPVPPKSQLRIRFPGVLAATDMYLKSEDGQPPSSAIAAAQRGDYAEMTTLIRRKVNMQQPDGKTGRMPLAVACHCGHDNIVQLLISKGVNIHSKDKQRLSPLHLAAANGHCKVIETLLDRAANINARGPQEKTPLRIASDHGELDAVRLLVSRRAMIDCRDDEQKTALHAVCRAGDEETARLLLGSGANKSAKDSKMRTPLHSACISGQVRVAEMLIEAKADLEAQDEKNLTPLAISAKLGLTAVVDLLLRHKASPKTKSAGDLTPLHWASYNGHDEAVVLLMANRKTELDARDINGYSPLHVAAMSRSFGVIENLLGAGAAVEAECHKGNRPLHYACRSASYSVVSLLLNAGADCNAQNDIGQTPLHVTVDSGRDARITKALITRGATVDAADRAGTRPLAIACLAGHVENTHVLLAQGASVRDTPDAPICLAASGGHVKVIQALLHRGGDVHQTDAQGWDPLRRAAFAGHAEAVACLLRSGARATVLGPLESFTFTSGATLEQCQRVFRLLITANQAEPDDSQRVIHLVSAARNVNAPEAMVELPQTELRGIRSRSNLNLPAEALSLVPSVLLTESSRPTAPESQVSIGADDGRGGPMLPSTSAPPLTLKRPDPAATLPSSPPRPIKATPNINLSTSGLEGETPGTVYYELDGREITGIVVV
jgi:ankyrin repeat protein